MTTISIELDNAVLSDLERYASSQKVSAPEYVYQALLSRMEDEHDLLLARQAKAEMEKDPTTYSLADMKKELGLS